MSADGIGEAIAEVQGGRVAAFAVSDEGVDCYRPVVTGERDDGHAGLRVGEQALIVGDAAPHPAQLDQPEWRFAFDENHEQAIETRRRLVEDASGRLVYSSHSTVGWRK